MLRRSWKMVHWSAHRPSSRSAGPSPLSQASQTTFPLYTETLSPLASLGILSFLLWPALAVSADGELVEESLPTRERLRLGAFRRQVLQEVVVVADMAVQYRKGCSPLP